MRPGPAPKPPQLRLLEGNPSKRPIPTDTAATRVPPVAPVEPRWAELLPGPDADRARRDARAEWRRVVPVLDRLGLLSAVDRTVLADYCLCWARVLECERALAGGLMLEVVKTGRDGASYVDTVRHPLSTTVTDYRRAMRAYIAELGLSPSARGRLSLPGGGGDEDDELFG